MNKKYIAFDNLADAIIILDALENAGMATQCYAHDDTIWVIEVNVGKLCKTYEDAIQELTE